MFEQIQDMVEKKIAADTKAFELQSAFVDSLAKRQSAFVSEAFEVVYGAAKDFAEVKSVTDVFEKQVAVGEQLKSKFVSLAEANTDEVKKLQAALADTYSGLVPAAASVAPAPVPAEAPAKKKAA